MHYGLRDTDPEAARVHLGLLRTRLRSRVLPSTTRLLGACSLVVLLFSWLALDDISTDDAVAFPLEYAMLIAAGIWFATLGGWLIITRRSRAGVCSLAAVAIGVMAFWSLPHHHRPLSVVNFLGYVSVAWFLGLAVWLLAASRSPGPAR